MKNFIIATAAGCILAMVTTKGAKAQDPINSNLQEKLFAVKMDKSSLSHKTNSDDLSKTATNAKALKDFKKSYKSVNDEKWTENKNCLTVRFTSNGINKIIFYDLKGNWEGSLKTYNEEKLDRNVRTLVKQKYFDYKITLVEEIETLATLGVPVYIVHLEGDKDFKNIRVTDSVMDIYREFEK